MNRYAVFIFTLSLTLAGCGFSLHNYSPDSDTRYTVSELRKDIYQIKVDTDQFDSASELKEFVLYRASIITVRKKYDYFTLLRSSFDFLDHTFGPESAFSLKDNQTTGGPPVTERVLDMFKNKRTEFSRPETYLTFYLKKGEFPKSNSNALNPHNIIKQYKNHGGNK